MSADQSFAVAMHALSVIAFTDPEPVGATFIAEQISVHPVVIRRTLGKLVNIELLTSVPGPKGGYGLNQPASKIDLWTVYSATHQGAGFIQRNSMPKANCVEGEQIERVLKRVYSDADAALKREFSKTTLSDILKEANC